MPEPRVGRLLLRKVQRTSATAERGEGPGRGGGERGGVFYIHCARVEITWEGRQH